MITTVTNAAALSLALKSAHAGDTIELASGNYGSVSISGLNFTSPVTITSLDPAHQASITQLNVASSSGLTFRSLDFAATTSGANGFTVTKSHDIAFDQLHVHGSLDHNPADDIGGLLLRESSNVSVTHSTFEQLSWGLGHINDSHVTVSGNTFHDMRSDGVRGGGSSYVTISGNSFSSFHPNVGDHPDAIQFWTTNTTSSAHDILVTGNQIHRGDGDAMQGIFLRDQVGTLPYQHVTITGNLASGTQYNGIYVTHAQDVTASDNIVQGYTGMKSWLRLDKTDGATVSHNESNVLTLSVGDSHILQSANSIIATATDSGAAITTQWLAAATTTTTTALAPGSSASAIVSAPLADLSADTTSSVTATATVIDPVVLHGFDHMAFHAGSGWLLD